MKRLALLVCFLLIACGNEAGTPATPRATMTPAAGAALVEQAVSLLLDRYVEPLGSADLYAAAYRGAVNTLQAAGAAPRPEGARQPPDFTGDPQRDAALFREAYMELANGAGANVSQTALAYDAIRAVTEKIDECHTSFLTPEQYRQLTARLEGTANYAGIGAGIRPTRPPTIGEIFPGTPAERGGLRPGDAILAVDGTDVTELTAEQIAQLVRGPAGTQVTLTVRRPGETGTRQITLTRARIDLPVLTSRIIEGANGEKIGYLKLYSFSTGAAEQLQEALEAFRQQGVTGWVLDLRGNGGGYIDTLSKIASRFIAGGKPVAYIVDRQGREETIETDPGLYFTPQRPLAVLIDEGSASSSEAFAAAVQDYDTGRLFGQTSAGCLAVASTFPLADGSALQITIQKVVSPERREINRVGVPPDEPLPADAAGGDDPVLEAALRWLADRR